MNADAGTTLTATYDLQYIFSYSIFLLLKAGDFCNHDNNSCEPLPDECQTDADCNVGLSGICDTDEDGETIECKYCESNGRYNVCKPGQD